MSSEPLPPGVVMFPQNHDLIKLYADELRAQGHRVALLPSFHYAAPLNFLKMGLLRARGYRVFHVHWLFFYPKALLGVFSAWARFLGYKIVFEVHNVEPHENSREVGGAPRRRFFQRADAAIVHYRANLPAVAKQLGTGPRIYVVPHPAFRADLRPSREEARRALGISRDRRVLLAFGAWKRYKGYEPLVRSFRRLRDQSAMLVIAGKPGESSLREFIEAAAAQDPRILLIPKHLDDAEMGRFFAACDAAVQPYLEITTSGAILMSLSHGRPVITTRLGGNAEVVEEGVTGYLCAPDNEESLVEAMERALNAKPASSEEFSRAIEPIQPDAVARQFVAIYQDLLTNGGVSD